MKSKITAGLLAIFLGGFGVHKFYLGQGGLGVLYLVFCWTYIPALVGFIEGIYYFTMDDEQFNIKYNNTFQNKNLNPHHNQPNQIPTTTPIANNIFVNHPGNSYHPPFPPQTNTINTSEELRKLHDLYVAGILTEEEFNLQKRKILNSN